VVETQPTSGGCLTFLIHIVVALLVGIGAWTGRTQTVDVPPMQAESVTLAFKSDASASDQQATADIIRQRLSALGITPDVRLVPADSANPAALIVLLPGGDDYQGTLAAITQPGDFELVDLSDLNGLPYQNTLIWTTHQAESGATRPAEAQQRTDTSQPFTTVLDNTHLMQAEALADNVTGMWTVHVIFDQQGGGLLGQFTAAHIGEHLAIVVDGRVLSVPIIQAAISGEAVIVGNFTESDARQLAAKIGSGRLPVPLEVTSIS
jgi:preprotein translocase subunit SecD